MAIVIRHAPRLAVALLACGLMLGWHAVEDVADAGGPPGGWVSELSTSGLFKPTTIAFAPDGRIFVAQLGGQVRIIENDVLLPTPFHTVFANAAGERGLVGLTLDPNFETNGYVYLFYTYETNIFQPNGIKNGQLIRVTANGNQSEPGSVVVLLGTTIGTPAQPSCLSQPTGTDCLPADGASHVGGALHFAPDGSLLVVTGDASYLAPDPPLMMTKAQDLDWLGGKMLRIDPATGLGLPTNPFYTGNPAANRSKVYAYGFRQPFRFSIRPGTSVPFLGEVGSNQWEEINVVTAGGNYGWPCFEGYLQHPTQSSFPFCQALYATNPLVQHPAHTYARVTPYGAAVIGGVFADGSNYPPDASGDYFFADYVRDELYAMRFDASNNPVAGTLQTILPDAFSPVGFEVGPDGDVYYAAWDRNLGNAGEIRHLRYVEGNRAPVAKAAATPQGGLAPLEVDFSSAGSNDPDGDGLTYDWNFGDGFMSTEANPSHTYTQNGPYLATLTVSDGNGGSDGDSVSILVGNKPPVATIAMPFDRTAYQAWQTIAFSGYGFDPESGALPASALRWSVGLRHCEPVVGGVCHTHPYVDKTGASGTALAPDQGSELTFLVIELTVTDAAGLTDTATVTIGPDSDGDGLLDYEEALTTGTNRFAADTDGGGLRDSADAVLGDPFDPGDDAALAAADADGDGCTNGREAGPNASLGGRRNVLDPWDFFDVWTRPVDAPNGWERDLAIDLFGDIFGVAARFGTSRGSAPTEAQALAEAAVQPADETSYHPAFDRGVQKGPHPWDTTGPDGSIDLFNDILGVAMQFGHSCE